MGFTIKAEESPSHTPEPCRLIWSKWQQLWGNLFHSKVLRWPHDFQTMYPFPVTPGSLFFTSALNVKCMQMYIHAWLISPAPSALWPVLSPLISLAPCLFPFLCAPDTLLSPNCKLFAPSLLHYFTLSFLFFPVSLTGVLQWVFITQ